MPKVDLQKFALDPLAFFAALTIPSAHGPAKFADVMAEHQREWFQAVAPSLIAVAAGKQPPIGRFWTERTKGASKDSDCACVLLWLLAFSPRKLDMEVGAADRDQAAELKKAAADILRLNDWLAKRIDVQSWTLLCKATGSECNIIATDIAGSHGSRPDIVVVNELSHNSKEEFSQNLLDNASKKPRGLVIVATNAGYQNTWQAQWRTMAQQSDRWHFHAYTQPAPWLSDEEVEEAARRNSEARQQRLYWGVWVAQSGDALDAEDIAAAINKQLKPNLTRPSASEFYVAGMDLGIKQDHSALVIIAASRNTLQLRLVSAQSWKPDRHTGKVDLKEVEGAVLAAHHRYRLRKVGYDPYQAQLMAQRLEQQKVPMSEMTFTGQNLNRMASTLLDVFRSRRLELFNHKPLIEDLGRLTIEEKSYGHRLSATRNDSGHADLATALAIALPIAIEELDTPTYAIGALTQQSADSLSGTSYFQRFLRHKKDFDREHSRPSDDDAEWRAIMKACGRVL